MDPRLKPKHEKMSEERNTSTEGLGSDYRRLVVLVMTMQQSTLHE